MDTHRYLTARWNNVMSAVLGIPALVFIAYAYATGYWAELGGMVGMSIIGVVY